jgi:hypothetical protein
MKNHFVVQFQVTCVQKYDRGFIFLSSKDIKLNVAAGAEEEAHTAREMNLTRRPETDPVCQGNSSQTRFGAKLKDNPSNFIA